MAKKRAHVDAALTATAASDCFNQDIEDMPEVIPGAKGKKEPAEVEVLAPEDNPNAEPPPDQEDIAFDANPKIKKFEANKLYAKLKAVVKKKKWEEKDELGFMDDIGFDSMYVVTRDKFESINKTLTIMLEG